MNGRWDFQVGDVIRLKKPHPCGGHLWQVLRVGMDLRLQCQQCGRQVMLPRGEVEKRCQEILPPKPQVGQ